MLEFNADVLILVFKSRDHISKVSTRELDHKRQFLYVYVSLEIAFKSPARKTRSPSGGL